MRAVIVYESMYGNTHVVADRIAEGLGTACEVTTVPVGDASMDVLGGAALIVVGGPTHIHGMTSQRSRRAAIDDLKPESGLSIDPDAEGPGLRDWFDALGHLDASAAAFDTRLDAPAAFTGRASKGITRRLRRHGLHLAVDPESFLVDKENHLLAGEDERAREWGASLAAAVSGAANAVRG